MGKSGRNGRPGRSDGREQRTMDRVVALDDGRGPLAFVHAGCVAQVTHDDGGPAVIVCDDVTQGAYDETEDCEYCGRQLRTGDAA